MPQFTYGNVELDLDWIVSYTRVSSPQQTLEHGGRGIGRQQDEFQSFATTYGVNEYTALGSLADEGTSGSTGKNIATGALGRFLKAIKTLPPRTGLVVESFSRLNRLPIDESLQVFLTLCQNDVPLITLQDRSAYTRKSLRTDKGQIYKISSMMQAARDTAESISYYSLKGWRTRRCSHTNNHPAWIMRQGDALVLDPDKLPTVHRFCQMALTLGVDQTCRILNAEGIPVLSGRKRQRGSKIWDKGTLLKILRGRQLLGQQEVAKYVDGKRVVTPGAFNDAYPAAISEELWQRIQIALDSRQSGVRTGRNVTKMTNMFGDLARCECGERMKVHRRGDRGEYAYLGCSAAYVGACKVENKSFFRLDTIERTVLLKIATEVVDDAPPTDDVATSLRRQIAKTKADAAKIEQAYLHSMSRTGDLAAKTQLKLEADHKSKQDEVTKLERELVTLETASPASELQQTVRSVLDRALAGDVAARSTIAEALPGLITRLTCRRDGTWRYQGTGRVAHTFGGKKSGRAAVSKLLDLIPE